MGASYLGSRPRLASYLHFPRRCRAVGMSNRSHLRAYFRLQEAHRLLHKALKAFEEDSSDQEILKRIKLATAQIQEAVAQLSE